MNRFARFVSCAGIAALAALAFGCSQPEEAASPSPAASTDATTSTAPMASPGSGAAQQSGSQSSGGAASGMNEAMNNPNVPAEVKQQIKNSGQYQGGR